MHIQEEYIYILITFFIFLFIWKKNISKIGYEYEWKNKTMSYLMITMGVFSILVYYNSGEGFPVQVILGFALIAGGLYLFFKIKKESFEDVEWLKLGNVAVTKIKGGYIIQGTDADNNEVSYNLYGKDKKYADVIIENNIREILIKQYNGTGRILCIQIPKK